VEANTRLQYCKPTSPRKTYLFSEGRNWVTKVKPDINSVECFLHNRVVTHIHPVDGVLVSCWFTLANFNYCLFFSFFLFLINFNKYLFFKFFLGVKFLQILTLKYMISTYAKEFPLKNGTNLPLFLFFF
jgi:hypothetical protein